jgi:hypothetical protein
MYVCNWGLKSAVEGNNLMEREDAARYSSMTTICVKGSPATAKADRRELSWLVGLVLFPTNLYFQPLVLSKRKEKVVDTTINQINSCTSIAFNYLLELIF